MRVRARAPRGVPASQRRLPGARGRQGLGCFVGGARRLAGPRPPRSGGLSSLSSFGERVLSLAPRRAAWTGLALGDTVQQAGNSVVHAQNSNPLPQPRDAGACPVRFLGAYPASWGEDWSPNRGEEQSRVGTVEAQKLVPLTTP